VEQPDAKHFHQMYGISKPRLAYYNADFIDYTLMTAISTALIYLTFGPRHWMTLLGVLLAAFMIAVFPLRHGFALRMPLILRRPQELLFMLIYKIRNINRYVVLAAVLLVLENVFIYFTPDWPHHVELMRTIGMYLFFIHFIGMTAYRTVVLVDHLRKRELVREFLMQTTWKKYLETQPSITLQIFHAYVTGVLTHIVYLVPWYLVISYANFSALAAPLTCVLNFVIQVKYLNIHNVLFYREHWLGHNSEMEFLYLHGTHHDAIPSGLIGVGGNGHLEGFLRHVMGFPTQFFNPAVGFIFFTWLVKQDIDGHQYIPCIFPRRSRHFYEITQHSMHHYGRLQPYSFGLKTDQPELAEEARKITRGLPDSLANSAKLDEQLTDFKWDNPAYRRFLDLFDKYQK